MIPVPAGTKECRHDSCRRLSSPVGQFGHWVEGLLRFLRPLELTTGMMLECIGGLDIDDSFTLTTRAFRCTFLDRFRHALVVSFHFPFPHRSVPQEAYTVTYNIYAVVLPGVKRFFDNRLGRQGSQHRTSTSISFGETLFISWPLGPRPSARMCI